MLLTNAFAGSPVTILGVRANVVRSDSMSPILVPGDRVISDTRYYRAHAPKRGDIIILLQPPGNELLLKRVSAIGGDVISLKGKKLTVNGTVVSEPYARYDTAGEPDGSGDFDSIAVPANHFFLMGDNRDESYDSRHVGPIEAEKIIGRVLYIYWAQDKSRIGRTIR